MDDLVAFLRARLDEDEQSAQSTMWDGSNNVPAWYLSASATVETGGDTFYAGDRTVANHIERHDPARVLREVEAKRLIMALHSDSLGRDPSCSSRDYPEISEDCETLRALAATYGEHPDYRDEWKP